MFQGTLKTKIISKHTSAAVVASFGAVPWVLFGARLELALICPLLLLIMFVVNDRYTMKSLPLISLAVLIIAEIFLVRKGAIPEGSQSYRLLYQSTLSLFLPLLFVVTRTRKIRKIVAINLILLCLGLVVVEVVISFVAPKRIVENQWIDLGNKFVEAPTRETQPRITFDCINDEGHPSQRRACSGTRQRNRKLSKVGKALNIRTTTDQPDNYSQRVLFFGGSTTFDAEVSDQYTYPSQFQRLLNDSGYLVRVENHGLTGAAAIHLTRELRKVKINQDDVVVFLIGVNEAKNSVVNKNLIRRLAMRFENFDRFSSWVFDQTDTGYLLNNALDVGKFSIDERSIIDTENALNDARDYVSKRGGVFVPVIQPHTFTRSNPLPYESAIIDSMGDFPDSINSVYPRISEMVLGFDNSLNAKNIFDDLPTSPFLDWSHVDKLGNETIAKFMLNNLKRFLAPR